MPESKALTALEKTFHRFAALLDGSAWFLLLPTACLLWWLDAPMIKTLFTWSLYFLVVAAAIIIITRVSFPMFKLGEFVDRTFLGSVSAGIAVGCFFIMFGLMVLSFVLWARPVGT